MGLPRPGGTAPHVLVADVEHPVLDDADRHHLERVRRLRPGAALTVTDGRGAWRWCRLGPEVEPDGDVQRDPAPHPPVTVGFALVKGERPELVVQKLTELGVDRIQPFLAARSVVRWDAAKADQHLARWRRITREAAMQCRRTHLPEVDPVAPFAAVAAQAGAVRADLGGPPPAVGAGPVLVGPEGGWDDPERAALGAIGLGPHVLRAETAAIAVASLLVALRSGVVATSPRRVEPDLG